MKQSKKDIFKNIIKKVSKEETACVFRIIELFIATIFFTIMFFISYNFYLLLFDLIFLVFIVLNIWLLKNRKTKNTSEQIIEKISTHFNKKDDTL